MARAADSTLRLDETSRRTLQDRRRRVRRLVRIAQRRITGADARAHPRRKTHPVDAAALTQRMAARRDASATKGRRQAVLGDLRKQRLVADLENPRGLGTVPANVIEHFQERFALGLLRPAASNLPEAALVLEDAGRERAASARATHPRGVVSKRSVLAGWSWWTPSRATSMCPRRNSRWRRRSVSCGRPRRRTAVRARFRWP